MNNQFCSKLKVGDGVAISSGYDNGAFRFGYVTAITPKRRDITVALTHEGTILDGKELRFASNGDELEKHSKRRLVPVEYAHEQTERRAKMIAVREAVNAVKGFFDSHRSYDGHYHVSPETKAKLLAMIEAMPTNAEDSHAAVAQE